VRSLYIDEYRHWRRRRGWRGASTQYVGEELGLIAESEQAGRRASKALQEVRSDLIAAANSCPDDRLRRRLHKLAERLGRDAYRVDKLASELGTLDHQLWQYQREAGLAIERHFHDDGWFFGWPGQSGPK
jgi:hypothetical protein